MHWNLSERLPISRNLRGTFENVVSGFIVLVSDRLKQQGRTQIAGASPTRHATPGAFSQVEATPLGVGVDESLKEFTEDLITNRLQPILFEYVLNRIDNHDCEEDRSGDACLLWFLDASLFVALIAFPPIYSSFMILPLQEST